jgi:hypothetical protein
VPRAIAINVAANSSLPGVRGPIYPDGSFEYVPIPEREPTSPDASVPTYADLDLAVDLPADLLDREVHLDPAFAGVHGCETYVYGDEHGVKAGPLSGLDPGDRLYFYATLSPRDGAADARGWIPSRWGAYVLGYFVVERAVTGEAFADLPAAERARFAENAHCKRDAFDAAVLVRGDDDSRLLDVAVPLSAPEAGATANDLVVEHSTDSGEGPWWRRVLRYDAAGAADLAAAVERRQRDG